MKPVPRMPWVSWARKVPTSPADHREDREGSNAVMIETAKIA